MRVLFVCPNRQTFVHAVPPIGPLYLAAALLKKGHEVKVADLMYSSDPLRDIELAVREFSPQVIGMSIRNIDTLFSKDIFEVPDLQRYVRKIRELSQAPLVLGGAGYSIFPGELFKALEADFGIAGEADNSLPLLVEGLENHKDVSSIAGLVYRKGAEIVVNPPDRVSNMDSIPIQAIELIDARLYGKRRGNLGVFTRKGCPLDCIYCPEAALYGHRCRLRSAKLVADEFETILEKTGVTYFDFADTLFNAPREHAMAVCQEIVDRKIKIKFEVELNPVGQDEESIKLLKAAGCIGVDLTADSGSETMLKNLNKGFTKKMLSDVAGLYDKHGLSYTMGYLLGGPGENLQTINETLEFTERLPHCSAAYFAIGIRVFKGTTLEKMLCEKGEIKSPEDLLKLNFYFDSGFNEACAQRIIEEYQRHLNYYLSDLFFEPFFNTLLKIVSWANVRPLWKYGTTPRVLQKLLNFGRTPPIYWDDAGKKFLLNKPR